MAADLASSPRTTSIAYALLGVPLAFFALPLYVHIPNLYVTHLGLSLSSVGMVLLGVRLLDAVTDPLIGRWSDRQTSRRRMVLLATPLLLIGWFVLFLPPTGAGLPWLASGLVVAYAGYSLASINYQAWGAEFPPNEAARLRVSAWREGAALIGVMLASMLPTLLAPELSQGLAALSYLFVPLLFGSVFLVLRYVPDKVAAPASDHHTAPLLQVFQSKRFCYLLFAYAMSGIAAAIPATLVLFYVSDVLGAGAWSGVFLLLYFLAAAATMPLWVLAASRQGRLKTWQQAMLLSMLCFAAAPFLGEGDGKWFALVCLSSGAALGADLVLPPALLAEHVARDGQAGACFGWWAAVTKLNLALAAGVSLPLLAWLGYTPGLAGQGTAALAWIYGGLPLLLKAGSCVVLSVGRVYLRSLDERGV